jgi:hypothetical protein
MFTPACKYPRSYSGEGIVDPFSFEIRGGLNKFYTRILDKDVTVSVPESSTRAFSNVYTIIIAEDRDAYARPFTEWKTP